MNKTDRGRPSSDGLFKVTLASSTGQIVVNNENKITNETNPFSDFKFKNWEPTEKEKEQLSDIITFNDACLNTCILDGE